MLCKSKDIVHTREIYLVPLLSLSLHSSPNSQGSFENFKPVPLYYLLPDSYFPAKTQSRLLYK